jgi:uncharacterized membrane protein YgaE (UPF0421/DUF939 family)
MRRTHATRHSLQARVRGCSVEEFERSVAQGLQKLPGSLTISIAIAITITITSTITITITIAITSTITITITINLPPFSPPPPALMAEVLQLRTDDIHIAAALASRVSDVFFALLLKCDV